jgi:hypothetical protein
MDFQAVTTKFGVVEYMTKYMTKSGQGSLLTVMEKSFSKCIEKAAEEDKGVRSAAAKFFNLAATQDVKCQLETMHLIYQLPRYLCSRGFTRMSTKGDLKTLPSSDQITEDMLDSGVLTLRTTMQIYIQRCGYALPSEQHLCEKHPITLRPLWMEVLSSVGKEAAHVREAALALPDAWPRFLARLSMWEFVRLFRRSGDKIWVKPQADIVIVSPMPRLATAAIGKDHATACRQALLAFCSYGPNCNTFRDAAEIAAASDEEVTTLMRFFVLATETERDTHSMSTCPVFLQRSWKLGLLRLQKQEARKAPAEKIIIDLEAFAASSAPPKGFAPSGQTVASGLSRDWRTCPSTKMSTDMKHTSRAEWQRADQIQLATLQKEAEENAHCATEATDTPSTSVLVAKTFLRMRSFLRSTMQLSAADLHDACLALKATPSENVSLLSYFAVLRHFLGSAGDASKPQYRRTHTKAALQEVLRCLSRGKYKIGGLQGSKQKLAERIAYVIGMVIEDARDQESKDELQEDAAARDFDGSSGLAPRRCQPFLKAVGAPGEVPREAMVDAAQAESALGHNLADVLADDTEDAADADLRAETEMLIGLPLNPNGVAYECLAINLDSKSAAELDALGGPALDKPLTQATLATSYSMARPHLEASVEALTRQFMIDSTSAAGRASQIRLRDRLDFTQRRVYEAVTTWAGKILSRTDRRDLEPLRLVLLGTAGTGKTDTIKCAIAEVRYLLKSYKSVLMIAHTGVACSNMGGGAATIDSVFKLGGTSSHEDLEGDRLESLVKALAGVYLIVVDEISMVGAAQFEMLHRRLEQVARSRWRARTMGMEPPLDMGDFGGFSVLLVGDFGQMPPILASSLIGAAILDRGNAITRCRAASGQRRFQRLQNVIMLRRIYRQAGQDAFKDSTLRLRDAVVTQEDHALWSSHAVNADGIPLTPWKNSHQLTQKALHLALENAVCGRINGQRLREHSRTQPAVVKMVSEHSDNSAAAQSSEEFRQLKQYTHLCVGAPVMLTQNVLWDTSVVPLGLMNGARGIVVAIMFRKAGEFRSDGLSAPTGIPCGPNVCPLADIVIVHFPGYTGQAFFQGYPRTWVPVPAVKVLNERKKSQWRIAIPLKLCWAMTVHKSQGITSDEGIILNLATTSGRNPVDKAGLPFVGFTRTRGFETFAVHELPALSCFYAVRNTKVFAERANYETLAARYHTEYLLQSEGMTLEQEYQKHFQSETEKKTNGQPCMSDGELADLRRRMFAEGMPQVDSTTFAWLQGQTKQGSSSTMADIANACRSRGVKRRQKEGFLKIAVEKRRKTGDAETTKTEGTKDKISKGVMRATAATKTFAMQFLEEAGVDLSLAEQALKFHPHDLLAAVEFCKSPACEARVRAEADQLRLYSILRDTGISVTVPTSKSSCKPAPDVDDLVQALQAMLSTAPREQKQRQKLLATRRAASQVTKITVPGQLTRSQYRFMAQQQWPTCLWAVCDLGIRAGERTNACFWLSVVAGWSRTAPRVFQDNAALQQLANDVLQLRDVDPILWHDQNPGQGLIGHLADRLRQMVCGPEGFMRQADQRARRGPAFAAVQGLNLQDGSMASYSTWLTSVAENQFADELVLAATADLLHICISTVPSRAHWTIAHHPYEELHPQLGIENEHRIVLGNDDVHYVWLRPY